MSSKTSSKRRYQSAAEFDDATIARKREYWRSKKREQRARKSSTKKKIGNENLGMCMSVVSEASNDPSLHNLKVLFKQEVADAPKNSFSSGLSVSESNITMVPSLLCQKARWFQRTKLNHALPQYPETSTNSLKDVMGNKKIKPSDTGSSKTNASTVESLCPTVHSVPTTCIELHPNSTHAQKTKSGMSSLNGKQLTTSLQSHVSMVLPVHRNQNKPQNSLRPLTSAECKAHENQSPITKRRTCAFASEHNTGVAMTEEEMVAKRRENWRIKKREQRAKHAAKLARARDREGSLRQGRPLSVGIIHASSLTNSKALRGISLNSNLVSLNQQSLGAKFNGSRTTQLHVQSTKPNHASLTSGILQSSSSKSKSKLQKLAHTQKRRQNQMRKSTLGASKVESPEDRHARQKEYWRIKKREQRARLSMALKARLKERDALKHRERCYNTSFNQVCGVQASKASAFAVSSDNIGGYIKEDGTVTVSISKASPEASLPASQDVSNVKCIEKVKLQVQVNSPLYSDAPPVTKLDSALCNVSSNWNAHQNSLVKSRLTRGAVMGSMTVTIQSETPTEEERVARLREYWRIKKREQRASRAARLGNGLLRSKVSVLKQREQNKKSNHRHSITSSIATTVCDSSTSAQTPIKEEHVYPTIQAVFSIPEITPCISVKDSKPSPCPSLESHIEPPASVDHHATTLQAVTSMKKLLEESVYTPEENNANKMHVKCENEPLPLTKDDLLTSEDAKPSLTIQQNVLLQFDVSQDTSLKDIKLSPQASTFEDTSHYNTHSICQEATDGSHAVSPVGLQPQKFSDDGADPKQSCPSQALQEQQLGESDELQRKREYWRLKKRQQRARKANKDATKHAVLRNLDQKKTRSTTLMQAISQDTSTCRQIPIQKKTSRCTKPSGPQTQPTDKSRSNRSQIVAMPNPQEYPEEVIHRRRMQWRIKKQEQRARKAAHERKLRQMMVPSQDQDSQSQNSTSLCSAVVQSVTLEDQLGYFAEPCQPALKVESSFAPNDQTEGRLSQAEWRNIFLMDFDPVNPLLVCMVCGEQQYSVSVEGVKAHIEEVHPDTLSLGDLERQGILDSWDKQVAVREHFITHQLQQRCRTSTEWNLNCPVKIEAKFEVEDFE